MPTKTVKQTVTMLNDTEYPVLFGAYKIHEVQMLDEVIDPERLSWVSEGAELHLQGGRNGDYPKSYTLVSEVPVIPLEELRGKTYSQLYNGSVDDAYLQIPRNFPDRVTDLAKQITESAETPYDKVILLQQYLQSNYSYTNTPDLSRKQSEDFVDSFLFEVREGYCDYFSTAMVMMTRSLDIPARWVKGYAPGSSSVSEYIPMDGQSPVSSGTYTVTNADAHSWVEVYFGEYGWIPIEATPGFSMPLLTGQPEAEPVVQEEVEEEEQEEAETTPAAASDDQSSGWWKGIGIAAAVVIALWIFYILWRMRINLRFAGARLRAGKPLSAADKVIAETERWLRSVQRKGLVRQDSETLRESVRRWSEANPLLEPQLKPLLQQFETARYSPAEVSEEQWRLVQADAEVLKKMIRKVRLA
jgi:transglutaminase-like putative cysteine protease